MTINPRLDSMLEERRLLEAVHPLRNPMVDGRPVESEQNPVASDLSSSTSIGLIDGSHSNAQGLRDYKLFIPKNYGERPLPLIVMLHGCKQDAEDFLLGTRMNLLAEKHACLVAYPVQPRSASHAKCWSWFKPQHQQRDLGEPSLIAGITRDVMENFEIDPDRVYVAGLSAGGAMAAIMVHTYPDLYAAAGIHSGLPYRRAHGLLSALAAMKSGMRAPRGLAASVPYAAKRPLIVFHGDADVTVHPSNGRELMQGFEGALSSRSDEIKIPDGRSSTRRRLKSASGIDGEQWVVHGAAHAWAGGSARGSYTDGLGPDASAEMMRFFLAHPMARGGPSV
jgi:poly(hydroxyalkanoate) depolymerase family esterase